MADITVPATDLAGEKLCIQLSSNDETKPLSDAEIEQISTLLESQSSGWSKAPRTYIVLWNIGRLDLFHDLLELGFSDFCFPLEPTALPPSLEPSVRRAIVQCQRIILTKSVDLEKGENGRHRHFGKDDHLPFRIQKRLGAGGYSQVDLIKSRISFKEYALKRIPRWTAFWNNSRQAVRQFAADMQLIKALKHRHIVQFVGSYTDPKYLGMIISPVADMNLAEYMDLLAGNHEGKQPIDFHIPEDEDTLSSLKKDFKAYPQYGLGHDWSSYSPQDAASLLLYFLKRLGQPLIPYEFLEAFRNPC
ncbi:rho gtpase activator [Botryosphaeria dothidea]|uniref:Rho gtpase activator n=1 Tax=Botryosphaeria dothidea TaxID=55169 RepID=A0A8H4IVL1_9PEZI|nr:rho gtpase activator [Botryosphaeria dothidea]